MDFRNVKGLEIPEGVVKELRIDGVSVWKKAGKKYSITIRKDNTQPITGLKYLQYASITFDVGYNVPESQLLTSPTWTVSGLPNGMSAERLNDRNLTVSGYPESTGSFTVTMEVRQVDYSDSKTYTLIVENVDYGVTITTDNSSAITGLKYLQSGSVTFSADYNVPPLQQSTTPTWTVFGLPSGMNAQNLSADSLTVSGYPESSGSFNITVGVTKGDYSDSKRYTMTVENVSYGVSITTDNANVISGYQRRYVLKTFSADYNVPPKEQNNAATWSITGLPTGLSASGATVSGYPENEGTSTVTVKVTKGSYSDTKQYTIKIAQNPVNFEITNTSLASGSSGVAYSQQITTSKDSLIDAVTRNEGYIAPSTLLHYASGLPSGLSINRESGLISGTTSNISTATYPVTLYAIYGEYRTANKTLNLSMSGAKPLFYDSGWSSEHIIDCVLSAADVRNADKVGSVIWSKTGIRCQYLGETTTVQVLNARRYMYPTSPGTAPSDFSFNGYSGEGEIILGKSDATVSAPVVKVSITMRNQVYKGSTSNNNYMDISITPSVKCTLSASTLKARKATTSYLVILLLTGSGNSTLTIPVTYTN